MRKSILTLIAAASLAFGGAVHCQEQRTPSRSKPNEVVIDFHMHIPYHLIAKTLVSAKEKGLDALVFTDYNSADKFDRIAENKDPDGKQILPRYWDIRKVSNRLLKVSFPQGELYLPRGEEIRVTQPRKGDILVCGTEKSIAGGMDAKTTFQEVYSQGGIGGFAHLCAPLFYGLGEEVFLDVMKTFNPRQFPLFLEKNAQVPERNFDYNSQVEELARKHNVALVGDSDAHGNYLWEYQQVGVKYHSVIEGISPSDNLIEDLSKTFRNSPQSIRIKGNYNHIFRNAAWNAVSTMKNFGPKVKSTLEGLRQGKK